MSERPKPTDFARFVEEARQKATAKTAEAETKEAKVSAELARIHEAAKGLLVEAKAIARAATTAGVKPDLANQWIIWPGRPIDGGRVEIETGWATRKDSGPSYQPLFKTLAYALSTDGTVSVVEAGEGNPDHSRIRFEDLSAETVDYTGEVSPEMFSRMFEVIDFRDNLARFVIDNDLARHIVQE